MTFPSEGTYPSEGEVSPLGYTFLELQEEVLEHQFSPNKYRTLVKRWLNQAQRRAVIESEARTQETSYEFLTEANVGSYSLPSDFSRTIDFYNTESNELLREVEIKEFDSLVSSTGRPYAYAAIGNSLSLYPTPDGVYSLSLRYWKLPADMVADSDTPDIAPQYHELLPAYALRKAFLREDDIQMAQTWGAVWTEGMLKMRGEVQHDTFDAPRQVPGTYADEATLGGTWW